MSEELLSIEKLERLSRREGIDVRPTLVRVLTDLFIQKPHHAPEEVARYQELALQLIEVVDPETRAVVARKLADEPRAPHAVIERLLADEFMVAAPLLARFPGVPHDTLLAIALDGASAEARAVAARSDIDPDMVRLLARHDDELVIETLAANPAVRPAEGALSAIVVRARVTPSLAAAVLRRDDYDQAALAPLYLMADPERRAAIREALAGRPGRGNRQTPDPASTRAVAAAADAGDRDALADALGSALGLKPFDAAWFASEPSGDALVMMMRAAGAAGALISRALLTCQPEIAKSVARFFHLVEIAESTPRTVASDLIAALVGAESRTVPARHEPMFDPSGAVERAGAARAAQRPRRTAPRPAEIGRNRG